MGKEFALNLADVRLLQTLRLLEMSMHDHPDRDTVEDVVHAISAIRDKIAHLAETAARFRA